MFNVVNEVYCQQKSVGISNVYNGMSLGKLVVSHFKVTGSTGKDEAHKCHCYLLAEKNIIVKDLVTMCEGAGESLGHRIFIVAICVFIPCEKCTFTELFP